MPKRQIKRLKGASRVDAAIRGMASIVDLGGLGAVDTVPRTLRGLPGTSTVRRGGWARGPVLPASKLRTSYDSIRIKDFHGTLLTVHDVARRAEDQIALGDKSLVYVISGPSAVAVGGATDDLDA